MISLKRLVKSFKYAFKGLAYTWKHEQNFRIQSVIGVLVLLFGWWLGLSELRIILLVLLVTMVLILELANTFFEKLVDILSPRVHEYVEILKDVLAAMVFVASLGAAVMGVLIFYPYIV